LTNDDVKETLEGVKSYAEDDRKDDRAALALEIALWLLEREEAIRFLMQAGADREYEHFCVHRILVWELEHPRPGST
jgi:hypothetical protein